MPCSNLLLPHRPRHAPSDFAAFWLGETISLFGSQVTTLALPLTAALTLGANAAQMGLLSAAQAAPAVLFGLFVGVWVDRVRRRPVLITANLARPIVLPRWELHNRQPASAGFVNVARPFMAG